MVRDRQLLTLLTSKRASRHSIVHFFNASSSKSGPHVWCFLTILTLKRASHHNGVHFFNSSTPKNSPKLSAFNILTWKSASCHCGVHFLISHLTRWLRTRRFNKPTFRPSGANKTLEKQSVSRLFYIFVHLDLLSTDTFSSDSFSSLPALISAFPSVHIVGSLTSKLLSIRYTQLCVYIYILLLISDLVHLLTAIYLASWIRSMSARSSGMYPILNPQLGIVYFLNP